MTRSLDYTIGVVDREKYGDPNRRALPSTHGACTVQTFVLSSINAVFFFTHTLFPPAVTWYIGAARE